MNTLPSELYSRIAVFMTNTSDKVALKCTSKELCVVISSMSIKIAKMQDLFAKREYTLKICVNSDCNNPRFLRDIMGISSVIYDIKGKPEREYKYKFFIPYCYDCTGKLINDNIKGENECITWYECA